MGKGLSGLPGRQAAGSSLLFKIWLSVRLFLGMEYFTKQGLY